MLSSPHSDGRGASLDIGEHDPQDDVGEMTLQAAHGFKPPFYAGAIKALRHKATDMNTLIAVGTSAACGYSVATILFPAFFRAAGLRMDGRELPMYFDTSSAISIQAINRKGDRHG